MLLIDNHDSFTFNLVELLRSLGKNKVKIIKPDQLNINELHLHDHIIFSPGPGLPDEQPAMFRILVEVEKNSISKSGKQKILGVCLGMQAIVQYSGGSLFQLNNVIHGQCRSLNIIKPSHPIFSGIGQPCSVGLYHSWAADKAALPECLEVLAESEEGVVMAIEHRTLPFTGVQFHPESFMTEAGAKMVDNWFNDV